MKILVFSLLLAGALLAQEKCNFTFDEKSGKNILIGEITRENLTDSSYSVWFNEEYDNYAPDTLVIERLKNNLKEYAIEVVFGTWCSDSRREVPRFLKILDLCGFPDKNLRLIAVDRNKKADDIDISDKEIALVPTFIIYKNNEEKGRIIETPEESLEKDLSNILN